MKLSKVLEIGGAIRAISALILLSMLAPGARAGLLYEPSSYAAQDALVLHLDGIRNVGANVPHDGSATVWCNLASSGPRYFTRMTPAASSGTMGTAGWTDSGFSFANAAYFYGTGFESGWATNITIEMTGNFPNADRHTNYPNYFCNVDGSEFNIWNPSSDGKAGLTFKDDPADTGSNSRTSVSSWSGRNFSCFMSDTQKGIYVEGVAVSTKTRTNKKAIPGTSYYIGDTPANMQRTINGTMNAFRLYNRALTAEEIQQNWQLDQYRFVTGIPVTNAVVATSLEGATGPEGVGAFAVDGEGYTFTAPACVTVGGKTYALSGYTLAAWNGSDWGEAVQHNSEYSVFVKQGDKVKITWLWEAASGSLYAGYVTKDLALRLDGIDNAGIGVHDASANVWKDLSGNGRDAYLAGNADGTSYWTAKGFYFNKNAVFATTAQFQLGNTYTIEGLVDSAKTDYHDAGVNGQVFCNSVNNLRSANSPSYNGWLYYHKNTGKWMFLAGDVTDAVWGAAHTTLTDDTLSYFTAFRDGPLVSLTNSAALPPSGQWAGSAKDDVPPDDIWCFGANSATAVRSGNQWNFKGTFKSFRAYTRLLTDEELAHNRAVDDARFFGKIPATGCVVVQSAIAGLEGREPSGLYFPNGWTFTAGSATQTVRDIEWQCVGYQLQTWDAATSTWGAQQTVLRNGENVAEYTPSGTSFASVRITWLWKPVKGRRAVRDYAVDDYVVGGAQLHLDGIDNVGVGVHNDSATVWKDLSGNGRDATLTTGGASAWTKDGYSFAGDAYFRTSASFTLGTIYTMQMLVDWNSNNMDGQNRMFLAPQGGTADGAIWWKNQDENIFFRGDNSFGSAWNACPGISNPLTATYLTSLRDGNRAAITTGTTHPKTTGTKGKANSIIDWFEGAKNNPASAGNWTVGADYQGNQKISAGVKSVRLYDRMLSEDELAWNRSVDSARFFNALTTTNVVEVISGVETAYKVEGEWTFNAPPTVTIDNAEKKVAGYRLEVLDSGDWKRKSFQRELSFRYSKDDEEVGGKTVKLIWSPEPEGLMMIVR